MNNDAQKNKLIIVGTIALGIVFLGAIFYFTFNHKSGPTSITGSDRSLDETKIKSSLTKSSMNFTATYGGDANPNQDAVIPRYQVFAIDSLGLPDFVKNNLETVLNDLLSRQVPATDGLAFIQVDKDTIDCKLSQNCNFSFYIDSPEMYFDFQMRIKSNAPVYTITQKPWVGR